MAALAVLAAACTGVGGEDTAGDGRDEGLDCPLPAEVPESYTTVAVPDVCTEMGSCAGPDAAFWIGTSLCVSGTDVYYDAVGDVLGWSNWTDDAEPRECPTVGDVRCDEAERYVSDRCVAYAPSHELDRCVEQPELQHGWFAQTLPEALAETGRRCLATSVCKVYGLDYTVVARIQPRECVDDPSRRYDIYDTLTGELVTSAFDPMSLEVDSPCEGLDVGWSRHAMPDCLRGSFEASPTCGFTLGVPPELAALLP